MGLTNMNSLSKEERELMVQQKMERMKKQNEEIMKRHAEIEEDKKSADMFSTAVAHHRKANPVQNVVVERKSNPRPPRAQRRMEDQGRNNSDQHPPSQDAQNKRPQRLSAGDGPPPDPSFNYLSDPFREGNYREDRGNRGGRQQQNSFRGQEYRNAHQGGGRGGGGIGGGPQRRNQDRDYCRDQPRSRGDNHSNRNMSGRDRLNYEDWKAERQKIDEERIARQKTASGEWRREWDVDKRFAEEENHANQQQGGFYRRPSWERGRGGGRGGGGNNNGENYSNYSNNAEHQNRNNNHRPDHRGRGRDSSRGGHIDHRNSNYDEQQQSGGYQLSERGRGRGQPRGGMRGPGGNGGGNGRGYPRGILPKRPDRWSSSSTHSDNSMDPSDDRAWLEDDHTSARDVTVNVDNTLTINVKGGISDNDSALKNHLQRSSFQTPHVDGSRANSNNMATRMNARNVGSGRIRPHVPQSEDRQGFVGRDGGLHRGRGGGRGVGRGGFRRGGIDRSPRNMDRTNEPPQNSSELSGGKNMHSHKEEDWDGQLLDTTAPTAKVDSGENVDGLIAQDWEVTQQQLEWQNSETGEWELPEVQSWKAPAIEEANEDSWEDVTSGGESLDLSGQSEDIASKVNNDMLKVTQASNLLADESKEDGNNAYLEEVETADTIKQRSISLASGYEEDDEYELSVYTEQKDTVDDAVEVNDTEEPSDLPSENDDVQAVADAFEEELPKNKLNSDLKQEELVSNDSTNGDTDVLEASAHLPLSADSTAVNEEHAVESKEADSMAEQLPSMAADEADGDRINAPEPPSNETENLISGETILKDNSPIKNPEETTESCSEANSPNRTVIAEIGNIEPCKVDNTTLFEKDNISVSCAPSNSEATDTKEVLDGAENEESFTQENSKVAGCSDSSPNNVTKNDNPGGSLVT